jgi:hypothetical protein
MGTVRKKAPSGTFSCGPPSFLRLWRINYGVAQKESPPWRTFFLRDFIASFRNLCFDPPVEMRLIFNELDQLKNLLAVA